MSKTPENTHWTTFALCWVQINILLIKFDLDRKLNPWLKFWTMFLGMVTKRKNRKDHGMYSHCSYLLLVFSVTPFKIDQNKKSKPFNRLSPKSLAKIQVTAIFLMEDMRRNVFPKIIEICIETPCWCPCPSTWAPTWRPETSRDICHWVLLQKLEFISRRTQKRNNNTLL